jgi:hypothetical protein
LQEELKQLSYFKDLRERRAWMARMTVLIAVLGLLILNVYLMYLSTNAVILNIDLARLEQSDQFDVIERRMELLDRDVGRLEAAAAAPPEAASR